MEKIKITWKDFHKHTSLLCEKIKENGEYDKIVAISRGGFFPAGLIAYKLDIRNCQVVNISSYDDSDKREDKDIEVDISACNIDDKTLVIDDLSDSGRTFNILKDKFPNGKYVCIYAKPRGEGSADIFAVSQPENSWLVFPWDL